jgi:hypothetical protein
MAWVQYHRKNRVPVKESFMGMQKPAILILPDQQKKPVHEEFHARDRRRDNPDYDQNQADKGQIVRSVRTMDKRHNFLPRRIFAIRSGTMMYLSARRRQISPG